MHFYGHIYISQNDSTHTENYIFNILSYSHFNVKQNHPYIYIIPYLPTTFNLENRWHLPDGQNNKNMIKIFRGKVYEHWNNRFQDSQQAIRA